MSTPSKKTPVKKQATTKSATKKRPWKPVTVDPRIGAQGRPPLAEGLARTFRLQAMLTPEINADVERLRGARSRSAWAADVVRWAVEQILDDPDLAARFALGRDIDE